MKLSLSLSNFNFYSSTEYERNSIQDIVTNTRFRYGFFQGEDYDITTTDKLVADVEETLDILNEEYKGFGGNLEPTDIVYELFQYMQDEGSAHGFCVYWDDQNGSCNRNRSEMMDEDNDESMDEDGDETDNDMDVEENEINDEVMDENDCYNLILIGELN